MSNGHFYRFWESSHFPAEAHFSSRILQEEIKNSKSYLHLHSTVTWVGFFVLSNFILKINYFLYNFAFISPYAKILKIDVLEACVQKQNT